MRSLSRLTAAMTFLLLVAGGLVTSTDSGLSVPDWPLSYGQVFPPMVGGIRYEHTHRLIAAVVALLIAALAVDLWRRERRRWVRGLGVAALGGVLAQAGLGGLTVVWQLPAPVSIAHACLGQLVFCLVVGVAVALSPAWAAESRSASPAVRRVSLLTAGAFFAQLVMGAVIRHSGRGLLPHIAGAVVLVVLVTRLFKLVKPVSSPLAKRLSSWLVMGLLGQWGLGILTLLSNRHPLVATAHVALGALLLACAFVMAMWAVRGSRIGGQPRDYLELTKPRLTGLAMIAVGVGFLMGASGAEPVDVLRLCLVVLGAGLVGGGANALNQWMERDADGLMARTRARPLPSGRVSPGAALIFAASLTLCGLLVLSLSSNALAVGVALATLVSYVGLYTPLKRVTSLCTPVGAIPGALPPLLGWAAASGRVTLEAWVLVAMLFCWQLPHFLAIAWAHREEYAQAGFRMLPVEDADGFSTARQMVLYGLALLPVSLLPTLLGVTGSWYFCGATVLGLWFLWMAVGAARARSLATAHRLFLASVGYLPAVLTLMVLDKRPV